MTCFESYRKGGRPVSRRDRPDSVDVEYEAEYLADL